MQLFEPSQSGLRDVGHQVVGNAVGVFANHAALVRADGVKVAQKHHRPFRVCLGHVAQNLLSHELRPAIGVDAAQRRLFVHRHARVRAVDRRRGGKYKALHAMFLHGGNQGKHTVQIVAVIHQGLLAGFAHGFQPREVDDAIHTVFRKHTVKRRFVADVQFVKREALACNLAHAVQAFGMTVYIVVHHHHVVSAVEKLHQCVRADVAGAASNQNVHPNASFGSSISRDARGIPHLPSFRRWPRAPLPYRRDR